jgi:hypothetical protein
MRQPTIDGTKYLIVDGVVLHPSNRVALALTYHHHGATRK